MGPSGRLSQSVTFRFRNFSNFLDSIGFAIEKIWYRKKYRIRYRKEFGIEKSIGIGIENIWYRKKDSDSVLFRFWLSSHTV